MEEVIHCPFMTQMSADTAGDATEDDQIYIAISTMDVFVRVWAGGGQLASAAANGQIIPISPIFGIGELRLGAGKDLKNTTVDFDSAFLKTNPQASSAFLNIEIFQRVPGSPTKFNVQKFGPLEVPFNGGTQARRQTSVSIV
jgi:hypothetical protein